MKKEEQEHAVGHEPVVNLMDALRVSLKLVKGQESSHD